MERIESTKYRVILQEVVVRNEGENRARAEVSLSLNGRIEQAERAGPAEEEAVLLSIAEATIDALNRLLPRPIDLHIEYIKQVKPRPSASQTILSLVRIKHSGKEILLSGSCPVQNSAQEAAARAMLDALNRTIELMLEQHELRSHIGKLALKTESTAVGIIDPPAVFSENVEPAIAPAKIGGDMSRSVRKNRITIAVSVLVFAIGGLAFYLYSNAPAEKREPEIPSIRALHLVQSSSSTEPGKTVMEKADQIIGNGRSGVSSTDRWLVMAGKEPNQFWVYFSFLDGQKNLQRAQWIVDVDKRLITPANPAAESISEK
jgi:hypothetical protein